MATYIAHGDVALSVLMTTASTLGAIFMTPLLTKLLAGTLVPVDAVVRPAHPRTTVEVNCGGASRSCPAAGRRYGQLELSCG